MSKIMVSHGKVTHLLGAKCKFCDKVKKEFKEDMKKLQNKIKKEMKTICYTGILIL